jgi:predicted nucleic acid-binding protein
MKTIIADTGFWIGLFMERDAYHKSAMDYYNNNSTTTRFLFPWPTMFETLRTQFVRDYSAIKRLEKELKQLNVIKYGDRKIRDKALNEMFELNLRHGYKLSLTDSVIRETIKLSKSNIKGLITINKSDFVDICSKLKVDILELDKA